MKFELIREEIPILDVANYLLKPGRRPHLFYYPDEQTPSIKIYPGTNSFFDFGRGIGGDCIRLWSHTQMVDSWTAAKAISSIWGLTFGTDSKVTVDDIKHWQQARFEAEEAKKQAWKRWRTEVDFLKSREKIYENLLESPHVKAFSEPWTWCINDLQKIRYRLDCLCDLDE